MDATGASAAVAGSGGGATEIGVGASAHLGAWGERAMDTGAGAGATDVGATATGAGATAAGAAVGAGGAVGPGREPGQGLSGARAGVRGSPQGIKVWRSA
jgi:hypothetical protein